MTEPSWDLYRTFLSVMRSGSLSAAARELGLTQPTAGRHIDALEQTLGHALFTRSQLGLMPTEAATSLLPYAETLENTAGAMLRLASSELDAAKGVVRIAVSDVVGVEVLPPILVQLQDRHPGIVIELSLSDAVEDLLRRDADIAVRMTQPKQEALLVRHVGTLPIGLYAHRDYIERHGAPDTVAALLEHRMVGFDRQTAFVRSAASLMRREIRGFPEIEALQWTYRCDSNIAQLAAVRAGAGIGFVQIP
jgi:DNA-binding transcriptional LysR family regulator